MPTKKEKTYLQRAVTKWTFLIFIVLLLTILQCSKCFNFSNIKPVLVFSFATSFFMFNSMKNSAILAIICGFFMDCFSDERAFGFSSLFLIVSCVIVCLFFKKFMQTKILNYIFINSVFFISFELINFILLYVALNFKNIWFLWINHIFPTSALTILISPIFYLICKQLNKIPNNSSSTANDQPYYESEL